MLIKEISRGKVKIRCVYCGTVFTRYKSNVGQLEKSYCSLSCRGKDRIGKKHSNWNPEGHVDIHGYMRITLPGEGRVHLHRHKMEQLLGRKLRTDEHVHHISGDKLDNRIENLEIISSAEHSRIHSADRKINKWSRKYTECIKCNSTERKHSGHGFCTLCYGRNKNE